MVEYINPQQGEVQTIAFEGFPKMFRISRDIIITEKIDGTNAQIYITEDEQIFAGSRKRWISPGKNDNAGFAFWVEQNKEELLKLGPGRHFGEWWGKGIQRGYDAPDKRFSLFNTHRWIQAYNAMLLGHDNEFPKCCKVVPVLFEGEFDSREIDKTLSVLDDGGSIASFGFTRPEGIVIYHTQANICFKKTLDGDGHKG